ncbi:hypothetical protein ACJX0J_025052 [Zea mays]
MEMAYNFLVTGLSFLTSYFLQPDWAERIIILNKHNVIISFIGVDSFIEICYDLMLTRVRNFSIDQRMLSFLFPNSNRVSNTIVARFILLHNKYVGIAVNKKIILTNLIAKKRNGFAYGGTS